MDRHAPRRKPTRGEREQRIYECFLLRLQGQEPRAIIPKMAEKWKLHPEQVRKYVRAADEQLQQELQVDRGRRRAIWLRRAEYLYAEMAERKDFRGALMALAEQGKFCGDYAPQGLELSGPGGAPIPVSARVNLGALSDAELEQLIHLLEKAAPAERDADAGGGPGRAPTPAP